MSDKPEETPAPSAETEKSDTLALADAAHDERKPLEHWAGVHLKLVPKPIGAHELHADTGAMMPASNRQDHRTALAVFRAAKAHNGWASHRELTEAEFLKGLEAFQSLTLS